MTQKKKVNKEEQYYLDLLEEMENDFNREENDQKNESDDSELECPNHGKDF